MKYLMFTSLAIFMIGSLMPIAQVSARSHSDDSYQTNSHDRYDDDDDDEDEDEDEDEDDDSYTRQNTATTPIISADNDARIKILQELIMHLTALLNQIKSGSTVSTPVTPVTPVASSSVPTYTKATVATHNTKASCWSIINSKIYDLTAYVSRHPGGSQTIVNICGKDGTSAFTGQHGGASKPEAILSGYYLAPLAR